MVDYQNHYNLLINRAKNRLLEGYTERHHIIPRCIGGTDEPDNLVSLTPEEHYVAHQLLIKIYPDEPKLVFAAKMMTIGDEDKHKRNNKLYGWLRKKHSEWMFEYGPAQQMKGKTLKDLYGEEKANIISEKIKKSMIGNKHGKGNFGRKREPFSKEWKQKIGKAAKGRKSWCNGLTKETDDRLKKSAIKISEATKGRIPWNKGKKDLLGTPVITPAGLFPSKAAAARHFNIDPGTVGYRIANKKDWYYKEKEIG